MQFRLTSAALLLALMTAFVMVPASATRAAPTTTGVGIPVNFTSALGSFVGTFDLQRFAVQDGRLVAIGQLTGTVTNAAGTVLGTVSRALALPVLGSSTGTCQILHLELGPLDLDLLGLQVHLDRIELDISAESGSGNLLGNLLCAVAHLLDSGRPLSGLAGLLNTILRLL